jgi:hypothetical protein
MLGVAGMLGMGKAKGGLLGIGEWLQMPVAT